MKNTIKEKITEIIYKTQQDHAQNQELSVPEAVELIFNALNKSKLENGEVI